MCQSRAVPLLALAAQTPNLYSPRPGPQAASASHKGFFETVLDQYFGDYITVAAFLGMGALLVAGAVLASAALRPNNPTAVKSQSYECGIDPVGGGWSQTQIRYYIFALLFLIFDVEAVFIFPWAVGLETFSDLGMGVFVLVEMVIFIGILVLGLVYAVRKGVLRWE